MFAPCAYRLASEDEDEGDIKELLELHEIAGRDNINECCSPRRSCRFPSIPLYEALHLYLCPVRHRYVVFVDGVDIT